MKTKMFKCGPQKKYKAYFKAAGKGFEVGMMYGTKSLFVGNFINHNEAHVWFQMMNREFARFSKKFWHNPNAGAENAFYHRFIAHNLYKHYYDYLDKCFGKYTRSYHREFSRDVKTYNKLKKSWSGRESMPYMRRAA
jgi:hypothetical protein